MAQKAWHFVPLQLDITDWPVLQRYYQQLSTRDFDSTEALEEWIRDRSELDAVISETFALRYIKITADSSDEEALEAYRHAVQELAPKIRAAENDLDRKLVACPLAQSGTFGEDYNIYLRRAENAVALFRPENTALQTDIQLKAKEYGRIFSEMTVGLEGVQMTLQKAGALLEQTDRTTRTFVYHKIHERIRQEKDNLEALFDELLGKRHQIALNAGFDNFRDYKFRDLGRFDYTPQDCFDFHEAISAEVLPLLNRLNAYRRDTLGLHPLRPWDLSVDTQSNAQPLRPFEHIDELVRRGIDCLDRVDPSFGEVLASMCEEGHLDLESRQHKRPGGYNMPLHLTGLPFIFMNATHSLNALRTLMHESGHAIHAVLIHEQPLSSARKLPSEIAELAAMTMELLTMEHWDVFFADAEDLRRAKIIQLENSLRVLPWIAAIDQFQHWIYSNPTHSRDERKAAWMNIYQSFSSSVIDYSGLEHYTEYQWHKQLHVFEVPFYYIEYGMAQLGAIAVWKQYRENPAQTVARYKAALSLGYTRTIGEVYAAMGITFNFSRTYIAELTAFLDAELSALLKDA